MMPFYCGCGASWHAITCTDGRRWWFTEPYARICPECGRRGEGLQHEDALEARSLAPQPATHEGRRCIRCKERLPLRSFFADHAEPEGRGWVCKDCKRLIERERGRRRRPGRRTSTPGKLLVGKFDEEVRT